MTNFFPVQPIWAELARIIESGLKAQLNLQSVILGDFTSQPTPGIREMVNGVWIHPAPALSNRHDRLPRVFTQQHNFRVVYLRRMADGENVTQATTADAIAIADLLETKYLVPDITNMPVNAQILWMTVKQIELEPQEDDLVSQIAADIRAVALQVEVNVRVDGNG